MSSNIDAAFVVQYQSEFSHVFQTQGSKLRSQVWVKNGVAGTSTKFPLLDVAQSTKNRARHSILSGDGDAHSSVTATLDNYESWRFIDSLDEFKTNIDVRRGYSESIVAKLGRDMDNTILTAANTTNTSAGSAAGMDMALVSKVTGLTFKYKWPTGKKTWVITPSVFEKLTAITQFGSRDYNDGQPLKEGAADELAAMLSGAALAIGRPEVQVPGIVVAKVAEQGLDHRVGPTIDGTTGEGAGVWQRLAGKGRVTGGGQGFRKEEGLVPGGRKHLHAFAAQFVGERVGATFGGQEGVHGAAQVKRVSSGASPGASWQTVVRFFTPAGMCCSKWVLPWLRERLA